MSHNCKPLSWGECVYTFLKVLQDMCVRIPSAEIPVGVVYLLLTGRFLAFMGQVLAGPRVWCLKASAFFSLSSRFFAMRGDRPFLCPRHCGNSLLFRLLPYSNPILSKEHRDTLLQIPETLKLGMQSVYDGYHALEERTTNPTLNWVRDLMRLVERTGNLGRTFTTPELLRLLQENDMWRTTSDTNAFQGAQLHFGRRIHEAFRLQGHENYLEIDSWLLTRGNHLQSYGDGRNGRKEIATYTVRRKPPVTMTTPETGSNASV